MYGKLENNILIYAPNPIVKNGKRIFNPSHNLLLEYGYKPIIIAKHPQDGRHYKQLYEETETEIHTVWVDNEAGYWQSIDYDAAVNAEIRKKYSESQEFSILRQRDEKPEEYKAYYDYCEQCKAYVKEKKNI